MKKYIHPKYYSDAKIICACGKIFNIGSTNKEIHVEICSNCHPFYTGKEKLVDSAGRVDRFKKMEKLKEITAKTRKGKADKKKRSAVRKMEKEKEKIKAEIKSNSQVKTKTLSAKRSATDRKK